MTRKRLIQNMKAAFSVLRMTTPILDPTYLLVCKFADCIRYSIPTRFEKNPFARNLEFAAYLTIATSICCLFTSWEPLALILRENMQQVSSGCNTCNRLWSGRVEWLHWRTPVAILITSLMTTTTRTCSHVTRRHHLQVRTNTDWVVCGKFDPRPY